MLLTITTTTKPATDLGYLLHKNPSRSQSVELPFGELHIFYPEASDEQCTVALLLDIDPVGLVRNRRGPGGDSGLLAQYVNDRPYVASSFLSVAISRALREAMAGRSKERPELASAALSLSARISVVYCGGGEKLLRRLFEPLGYAVDVEQHQSAAHTDRSTGSPYFTVSLKGELRLSELLSHIYVLIPVLDDEKHYWVSDDEVDKLLKHGEGWLQLHPERELIAQRYLKHRHSLVRDAIARIVADEDPNAGGPIAKAGEDEGEPNEKVVTLNEQRYSSVLTALRSSGASSVLDLGCGEGRLLRHILAERQFSRVVGMDVSHRALERASSRLRLDQMPDRQRERLTLLHGSLMYRDNRLEGFDAAAVVEVVEHLDPPRLAAFERVLFEFARPSTVVLTTPNSEYNVRWPTLPAGKFRHGDHRFEWSRAEFQSWANSVCHRFGYDVRFAPVGPVDDEVGSPTQMAIFTLADGNTQSAGESQGGTDD